METNRLKTSTNTDTSRLSRSEIDVKEVSKYLKKYMKKKKYSGYKIFEEANGNVSKQTVYNIINCKIQKVSILTVFELENALNIRLFERDNNQEFNYWKFRDVVNHSSAFINSEHENVEELLIDVFCVDTSEFIEHHILPPISVQEKMSKYFGVKLNELFVIDGELDFTREKLCRVSPNSQASIDYDTLIYEIKNLPKIYQNLIVNMVVDMGTMKK